MSSIYEFQAASIQGKPVALKDYKGRVLLTGRPADAIAALESRIWRKRVPMEALPRYQQAFAVLSTRLVQGTPEIHVYAESEPEEGFEPIRPDLEDVYFQRLRQQSVAA